MSQTNNNNNIFLKLQQIRPTKNISNIILMYDTDPAIQCLTKQFDDLRKKEFVDDNGVTFLGKTTYVAGKLNISFLATLMLADFVIQHTRKPEHDKTCRVDTSEIRAKLSPIASKNRLKMLTSELLRNGYLEKRGCGFFLNHNSIEKITSIPFFDGVIDYLHSEK